MMRAITLAVIAAIALAGATAHASVSARPDTDPTPLSCDGKPADFHAERAKQIIDKAYDRLRVLDESPVSGHERQAWQVHKRCLRDTDRRKRIGRYAHKAKAKFAALFVRYITPPGEGWLASTRWCESGSSGSYDEGPDAGYAGAYQFDSAAWAETAGTYEDLTGLDANPSRNAAPREQDIRAAILYRAHGSAPWPVCG